jgi:heptosyltransferase I
MASHFQSKPNAKKILLIKIGAMGDLVIASTFFDNLRKVYPKAHILLLTGKSCFNAVKHNPCIDEFILADDNTLYKGNLFSRLRELFRIVFQLRKYSFDLTFIMHRAWQFNVLAYLVGTPRRVGFARGNEGITLTDSAPQKPNQNERESYLDLLRLLNLQVKYERTFYYYSKDDKIFLPDFLSQHQVLEQTPVLAVVPGGGHNVAQGLMATRRWPADRYIELAKQFKKYYGGKIFLVGGPGDREVAKTIALESSNCIDATHLSLGQMASLFERCQAVVGNDCGPLHIATAMQKPTISIYGPTNPNQWASPDSHNTILFKKIECSPCFYHGKFPECDHLSCLTSIEVSEVMNHLKIKLPPL